MNYETKQEILAALALPWEEFSSTVLPAAKQLHREQNGDHLTATAMLGYSNVCKNQCLYCGMRAANSDVPRYRIEPEEVLASLRAARETGFTRIFLISGEDPKYDFEKLLRMVEGAKKLGMTHVSLACGEFERSQYEELRDAGADEYVLKFEMSHKETFDRLNPSTNFEKRSAAIGWIRESGMELASGNIVDYPGQTLDELADDILLMRKLGISWAPIVPYLPAKNTPLAAEGGPGRQEMILREIALTRLMIPAVNITGGQPGKNLADGFSSVDGTQAALAAGANLLFADLLPAARAQAFRVVDNRTLLGLDHIQQMAEMSGMTLCL